MERPNKKHRTRLLTGAIIPTPSDTPFVSDTIKWSAARKPVIAPGVVPARARFGVGKHSRKSKLGDGSDGDAEDGSDDDAAHDSAWFRGKLSEGFRSFLDGGACGVCWWLWRAASVRAPFGLWRRDPGESLLPRRVWPRWRRGGRDVVRWQSLSL